MKKILILMFAVLGLMATSTEVLAQAPNGQVQKGCPDGFNLTIGQNVIIMNCDWCFNIPHPTSPSYHCEQGNPMPTYKPGACFTCYVLYDGIETPDGVIDVVKIPAVNRAWVYETIINDGGVVTINTIVEIDIEELLLLLDPGN